MSGKPITRDYAERRMANEPLAEIIQAKGQSDTSPALSPTDEFANFEMWVYLIGSTRKRIPQPGAICVRPMALDRSSRRSWASIRSNTASRPEPTSTPVFPQPNRATIRARTATRTTIPDGDYRYHVGRWRTSDRTQFRRTDRRLGRGEHSRIHLRGFQAQRDLRHLGRAHQGAHVRRLELSEGLD